MPKLNGDKLLFNVEFLIFMSCPEIRVISVLLFNFKHRIREGIRVFAKGSVKRFFAGGFYILQCDSAYD